MLALLMIQNEFIIVVRNVFSSYVVLLQKFRKMSRRRRRADFIDSLNSFRK